MTPDEAQTKMPDVEFTRAQRPRKLPLSRRLTAWLTLALFCWLNLLAVAPRLHREVCGRDANSVQHQCAVTLLAKGQITPAGSVVILAPRLLVPIFSSELPAPIWAAADFRLSPSRAPPSRRA